MKAGFNEAQIVTILKVYEAGASGALTGCSHRDFLYQAT
jgi:hypothetical protein